MRLFGKVDANQREIVETLRRYGCSVQSLAAMGDGCPDLLIGIRGRTILAEVKDGRKPPSKRTLTDDQRQWCAHWEGSAVQIFTSVDDVRAMMQELMVADKTDTPTQRTRQARPLRKEHRQRGERGHLRA